MDLSVVLSDSWSLILGAMISAWPLILGAMISGFVGLGATQINSYLDRTRKRIKIASAVYCEIEAKEKVATQFDNLYKGRGDVATHFTILTRYITDEINKNTDGIPLNVYNPLYTSNGWYYPPINDLSLLDLPLLLRIHEFHRDTVYFNTLFKEYYNKYDKSEAKTDFKNEEIEAINLEMKKTASIITKLAPGLKDELKINTKWFLRLGRLWKFLGWL